MNGQPPTTENNIVISLKRLVKEIQRLRRKGKTVAFTNGCFDLLHAGHLDYLERTKRLADVLIVGLNTDASVRRLKGPGRPVVSEKERARLVAALKPVDFVTLFAESTPIRVIRAIHPEVLAKGADWKGKEVVGQKEVESWGGRVVLLPYLKGHSTTDLIRRVEDG